MKEGPRPARPWTRSDAAAAALLAALAAVVLSDALFSGGRLVAGAAANDMPAQFLAWREFGFTQLRAGHLALWNPHSFSGAPFLGAFESGLLYPPNWVHLFLGLGEAVNVTLWLHLFLAGTSTFLWARRRGAATAAAAAAGAAYMCGGPFFLHVYAGHLPAVCVMAWAPALLACAEAWAEGGGRKWLLSGGAVFALQVLAGNPQFAYFDLLGALVLAAAVAPAGKRLRAAGGVVVMAGVGAALSAVQLLPGLEAASESVRARGVTPAFASSFGLPWENVLTTAVPRLFGGGDFPYFGRSYFWEASLYAGATTLALAALAVVRGRRRERVFAAVAGLFLIAALGAQTPLFGFLYHVVPGFAFLRAPARFSHLIALLTAVLCAEGLSGHDARRDRFAGACAALALLLAAAAAAWGFGSWGGVERAHHEVLQLLGAAVVLGALAAAWSRLGARRASAAAGLVIIEMNLFAFSVRACAPTRTPYPETWRRLSRAIGDARVLHDMRAHPNAAMRSGAFEAWGYSSLVPRRYARFMAATQGAPTAHADQSLTFERFTPVFALTRVRYVFVPGPEENVLELPAPMPRAGLLGRWRVVGGEDESLRAVSAPGFDPRREAVLEEDPGLGVPSAPAFGDAVVVSSDAAGLVVAAETSSSAVLLLTDSYSRAWRARPLPGSSAAAYRVMPVDHAFVGVPLEPGVHLLRFDYEPRSLRAGALLSLLALGACAAWAFNRRGRGSAS